MHKPERDWFIRATENFDIELTEKRRSHLAIKGELLYTKYCHLKGNGICAESFAEYHLLRGEYIVVTDFLNFLHDRLTYESNPAIISITEELVQRVEMLIIDITVEEVF